MPTHIVKHETRPATWARFEDKNGGEAIFASRDRATEFDSPEAALQAFKAASDAMWARVLAARAAAKARTPAPAGAWPGSKPVPNWLLAQHGERVRGYGFVPMGKFSVESVERDAAMAETVDLIFARSELGWLCGPKSKSDWGKLSWSEDFARALPFHSAQSLADAARLAPQAQGVSSFTLSGSFSQATLAPNAFDQISLGLAASVERRALDAQSLAAPKRSAKAKTRL